MKLPSGFRAGAVAAGLKSSGALDLTIIENQGPDFIGTAVFTSNKVLAAPVMWTKQVIADHRVNAVVMNSGGANACTGPRGFSDTHRSAEYVADRLGISSADVAVCSTGLIGEFLPMDKVISGVKAIVPILSEDGLESAARAIMTTDSVPKLAASNKFGVSVVGIAKGAGMLAPSLATMLSVVMTDAIVTQTNFQEIFTRVCDRTFNRIDSDGCTSTNDTVLLLSSGASSKSISNLELEELLTDVCGSLAQQLVQDAEGHTKIISITIRNAATEEDAVNVGRACARNNLLKCALFGNDPNWGRILAAVGTAEATFNPLDLDVSLNGIMVAKSSGPGEDRLLVDLSGANIEIIIDLKSGSASATIMTNDLSYEYVHENSAYAT